MIAPEIDPTQPASESVEPPRFRRTSRPPPRSPHRRRVARAGAARAAASAARAGERSGDRRSSTSSSSAPRRGRPRVCRVAESAAGDALRRSSSSCTSGASIRRFATSCGACEGRLRRDCARPVRALRCAERRRRDGLHDLSTVRAAARPRAVAGDIRAAALWLRDKVSRAPRPASSGFCMGGRIALTAAVDDGDRFSVVAPFYGDVAARRSQSDAHSRLRQLRRTRHGHSSRERARVRRRADRAQRRPHLRRSRTRVFRRSARFVRGVGRGGRVEAHDRVL